jgi:hypothetical protein
MVNDLTLQNITSNGRRLLSPLSISSDTSFEGLLSPLLNEDLYSHTLFSKNVSEELIGAGQEGVEYEKGNSELSKENEIFHQGGVIP